MMIQVKRLFVQGFTFGLVIDGNAHRTRTKFKPNTKTVLRSVCVQVCVHTRIKRKLSLKIAIVVICACMADVQQFDKKNTTHGGLLLTGPPCRSVLRAKTAQSASVSAQCAGDAGQHASARPKSSGHCTRTSNRGRRWKSLTCQSPYHFLPFVRLVCQFRSDIISCSRDIGRTAGHAQTYIIRPNPRRTKPTGGMPKRVRGKSKVTDSTRRLVTIVVFE